MITPIKELQSQQTQSHLRDIMYNSNLENVDIKPKHSKKNIAIAILLVIVIFSVIAYVIDVNYKPTYSTSNINNSEPTQIKLNSALGAGLYNLYNLSKGGLITNITLFNQVYNLNISKSNLTKGLKITYYGSNSILELISVLNTSALKSYQTAINHEITPRPHFPSYTNALDGFNYTEFYYTYNGSIKSFFIFGYYKNYFVYLLSTGNYNKTSLLNYTLPELLNIIKNQTN